MAKEGLEDKASTEKRFLIFSESAKESDMNKTSSAIENEHVFQRHTPHTVLAQSPFATKSLQCEVPFS